jgi:hypothetical protein
MLDSTPASDQTGQAIRVCLLSHTRVVRTTVPSACMTTGYLLTCRPTSPHRSSSRLARGVLYMPEQNSRHLV